MQDWSCMKSQKEVHCYHAEPRVKRWPVMVWRSSIWQRNDVVTSACRLHFLFMFPVFPSLPFFPPTLESIWKINCVTLNVICCLLLPDFHCLPPLPLSPFLYIFPPLSLAVCIWSQLQHLPSVFGLSLVKYVHNWKCCIDLENCMRDIAFHLHPFPNLFAPSSLHCLYFIKYGLGMSSPRTEKKLACGGVFMRVLLCAARCTEVERGIRWHEKGSWVL